MLFTICPLPKLFNKQDSMNVMYNQPFMTIEGVFEKDDNKELVQCAVKIGVKKWLNVIKKKGL